MLKIELSHFLKIP